MIILYRGSNHELNSCNFKENRPSWFSKRRCLSTLSDFDNEETQLICIFDGHGDLSDWAEKKWNLNVRYINAGGNPKSLDMVYDIYLSEFAGQDVYFVEDDYLHKDDFCETLKDGIKKFGLVTLYDHTDRYTRTDDINFEKEKIRLGETCYWRTAESTTCTWAARGDIAVEVVTEAKKFLLEDRAFFRHLKTNKNIDLWTPMPALACHMNKDQLSPFTDWKNL